MILQTDFGLEDSNVKGSYNQEDNVQVEYWVKNRDNGPLM